MENRKGRLTNGNQISSVIFVCAWVVGAPMYIYNNEWIAPIRIGKD